MHHKPVSDLINDLHDDHWLRRSRAAESLGELGPEARDAVAGLRKALTDNHVEVRRDAAEALGKIKRDARDAVPDLVAALNDCEIGRVAGNALESIGLPAVPELINALSDSARTFLAERILVSIGEPALDQLLASLDSDNQTLRSKSIYAIASIGSAGRTDVLEAMTRMANDTSQTRYNRFLAANALERIDPSAAAQADVKSIYADLFRKG